MPGLISYHKLLPYSGIDLNHHLNPLPRFERDQAFTTQKRFLDREVNIVYYSFNSIKIIHLIIHLVCSKDVIKGIMSWKKFPSQGLISLSNTPTLTDVWVPRWSNTLFSNDLLPDETPNLLTGLSIEDKNSLLDDS